MFFDFLSMVNHNQALIYVILRSIVLFFITTIVIRFGAHRVNLSSVFDTLLIIILGGLISRGINGSATLISTLTALVTLVALHKLLAKFTYLFPNMESIFKGKPHILVDNGKLCTEHLKRYNITARDLEGALREQLNTEDFNRVNYSYLEQSGKISFVKKDNH